MILRSYKMDDRYKKYVEYMWNSYNSIYNIKMVL